MFYIYEEFIGDTLSIYGYIENDVYKTVKKARKKYLKAVVVYKGPIKAPIKKNDILGKLKISYNIQNDEEWKLIVGNKEYVIKEKDDIDKIEFNGLVRNINLIRSTTKIN